MFAVGLFLTAVDLCSCRSCRLAWPDTDQSHPPVPGVLRRTGGSRRTKKRMKRMRWMVVMKMSEGWLPCPSPLQRWKGILRGTDTACRHAYGGDKSLLVNCFLGVEFRYFLCEKSHSCHHCNLTINAVCFYLLDLKQAQSFVLGEDLSGLVAVQVN